MPETTLTEKTLAKIPLGIILGLVVTVVVTLALPLARAQMLSDARLIAQQESGRALAPYATREWVTERLELRIQRLTDEIVALRVAVEKLR